MDSLIHLIDCSICYLRIYQQKTKRKTASGELCMQAMILLPYKRGMFRIKIQSPCQRSVKKKTPQQLHMRKKRDKSQQHKRKKNTHCTPSISIQSSCVCQSLRLRTTPQTTSINNHPPNIFLYLLYGFTSLRPLPAQQDIPHQKHQEYHIPHRS